MVLFPCSLSGCVKVFCHLIVGLVSTGCPRASGTANSPPHPHHLHHAPPPPFSTHPGEF
jgi:hypothetical protein